jgi:putative MFS transporter
MFFLGVGTAIIGAASGNIGLSPHQTGLLVSVQNVGFILAVLIAGALADSAQKPRLLAAGSFILSVSFFLYYLWRPYGLNLLIMFFIGAGIGTYEGVADAMLLDLHEKRQALFISINHFFVTFGCLAITLYLLFLQMDWRRSIIQSAAVVLVLAVIYAFSRAGNGRPGSATLRDRLAFLKTQAVLALFLALATIGVGIELGLTALLTGFLMSLRGYNQVGSKLGRILGLISARGRILGLSVLLTGIIYRDMSGTALGIVKLGVPLGGILIPFVLSLIARYSSFRLSLIVFPALALTGCLLLAADRKLIGSRLQEASRRGSP